MSYQRYPSFRSATLKLDAEDFNQRVLNKIRKDADTRPTLSSYVTAANDLIADATEISAENIVAIRLGGHSSDEIDHEDPEVYSQVHPRPDGARIACLMLAGGTVALTHMAPHWAGVSLHDTLNVLWIFDDESVVSQYYFSEDLNESMMVTNGIEDDHKPLTQEEVKAWQKVAAEASHIGVFEVVDLLPPTTPFRDAASAV
jgi:hypothetical protein